MEARSYNHSHVYQSLHTLMDCGSAYATLRGHILEGQSGIGRDKAQDFFVKAINLFHIRKIRIVIIMVANLCKLFVSSYHMYIKKDTRGISGVFLILMSY